MISAIAGDIIGSGFERSLFSGQSFETAVCVGYDVPNPRTDRSGKHARNFRLFVQSDTFTDDSVFLVGVMEWLLGGRSLAPILRKHFALHPTVGWGTFVEEWAKGGPRTPCRSFGNGAAMRVAPLAYVETSLRETLTLVREASKVTHKASHAIAGAEALATGIFMAREGSSKKKILEVVSKKWRYPMNITLNQIRPFYSFTSLSARSVPISFRAFYEGSDYEDVVRRAISVGGDSDTLASMAGALAGAYYGVPKAIAERAMNCLRPEMRSIVDRFEERYLQNTHSR